MLGGLSENGFAKTFYPWKIEYLLQKARLSEISKKL